jgi:predicted TIM-barrel fold metal-dependent hydrolase
LAIRIPEQQSRAARTKPGIIDCDVHNGLASPAALKPYLASRWYPYYDQGSHIGHKGQAGQVVGTRPAPHFYRKDAMPDEGVAGSDYGLLREQLLEGLNVVKAVLSPLDSTAWVPYGDLGAALVAALNDWMIAEWLDRDDRLTGAVSITVEDTAAAVAEIERVGSDARFVAVLIPIQTREGLGHPKYWPIYDAAVAHDLRVILHVGGMSGTHLATGFPTYFVEQHSGYSQVYGTQVTSIVYSGALDRYPGLDFVLEEGGVAWLPATLWRLDRTWEAMAAHAPHLERRPSEVVRERFWLTTQPFDEPEETRFVPQLLEQLGMNDRLMFSSDYPHWDFDDPARVLPVSLIGKELHEDIFRRNAERCFSFGATS